MYKISMMFYHRSLQSLGFEKMHWLCTSYERWCFVTMQPAEIFALRLQGSCASCCLQTFWFRPSSSVTWLSGKDIMQFIASWMNQNGWKAEQLPRLKSQLLQHIKAKCGKKTHNHIFYIQLLIYVKSIYSGQRQASLSQAAAWAQSYKVFVGTMIVFSFTCCFN